MPTPSSQRSTTKLQRLVAVFERFHESVRAIPDDTVSRLCENWNSVKGNYVTPPPGVRPSQLAAGLEQGLLELPMFTGTVASPYRANVANALHEALLTEYPAFMSAQAARLSKILERGRIASESQFMLVRHAVDVAEGKPSDQSQLQSLYSLIDAYEARGRRVA